MSPHNFNFWLFLGRNNFSSNFQNFAIYPTNALTNFVTNCSGHFEETSKCFSAVVSKMAFFTIFSDFSLFCGFSCHNCFDSDLKAIQKYILSQSSNFQLWSFLSKTVFSTIFPFNVSNFLHHIICLWCLRNLWPAELHEWPCSVSSCAP